MISNIIKFVNLISHIIAHIHLKPNSKLALHNEDDGDKTHSAEHNPEQQLGGGGTADTIADVDISLGACFCENKWVEYLGVWVELCQSGQVCDPGGVVAELDIVLGWIFVCRSRQGRGADL